MVSRCRRDDQIGLEHALFELWPHEPTVPISPPIGVADAFDSEANPGNVTAFTQTGIRHVYDLVTDDQPYLFVIR
jgi:hypothetical protein